MPKKAAISYVANMVKVLSVCQAEVEHALMSKPYSDPQRWIYFLDLGQILKLLPAPPARVLDLGTGSGWTAEFFARCGYAVVGVDIAPDMIELARRRLAPSLDLRFEVCDYEAPYDFGEFDAVVSYDALHYAENDGGVIQNACRCLREGGLFVTAEPGLGHATTPETRDVVAKFGTTERDMPYQRQATLMRAAGFGEVRQYLRLSQCPLEDVSTKAGRSRQDLHFKAVARGTENGLTSIVVAVKGRPG